MAKTVVRLERNIRQSVLRLGRESDHLLPPAGNVSTQTWVRKHSSQNRPVETGFEGVACQFTSIRLRRGRRGCGHWRRCSHGAVQLRPPALVRNNRFVLPFVNHDQLSPRLSQVEKGGLVGHVIGSHCRGVLLGTRHHTPSVQLLGPTTQRKRRADGSGLGRGRCNRACLAVKNSVASHRGLRCPLSSFLAGLVARIATAQVFRRHFSSRKSL